MTTKTLPAALAAVLLLSACAPTVFDPPPGGNEAQFHRDNLECAAMARGIVGDSFAFGPPLFVAAAAAGHNNAMRKAHDECMLGKSYTIHQE